MKLVNGFDLMEYAKKKHYILPAFNTTNLEMTYAIANGLMEADLPGYIQISSNNLRLSNPYIIAEIARDAVKNSDTPIGLHLDHGKSFEDVKACVDAGFTSIMIDASHLPFEENVKECRRAAEYCHFYGLPVEAELGALQGKEEDIVNEAECKTDPDMVADFVERTGCDVSAVKPESKFSELGIDSLDTVELLMSLEDEIGIEIELDQKVETIDDLDRFIQSKQG